MMTFWVVPPKEETLEKWKWRALNSSIIIISENIWSVISNVWKSLSVSYSQALLEESPLISYSEKYINESELHGVTAQAGAERRAQNFNTALNISSAEDEVGKSLPPKTGRIWRYIQTPFTHTYKHKQILVWNVPMSVIRREITGLCFPAQSVSIRAENRLVTLHKLRIRQDRKKKCTKYSNTETMRWDHLAGLRVNKKEQ